MKRIFSCNTFSMGLTAMLMSVVICLLLFSACSTKKNAFLNRTYHNLTARDNGWFNANNKVNEGAEKLAASHEDKYDRIISVFKFGDAKKGKAVESTMDEAIKKSTTVIERHSMLINGVEYCSWIDDNYILIGRAEFYKHDFPKSLETFEYVSAQYRKEPSRFDAYLWMAKIYLEQKNFSDADNIIGYLQTEAEVPKKLKGDIAATASSYHLLQKNYDNAVDQLKLAVKLTKKRTPKTRYMFILAQVYQKKQEYRKAFDLYSEVIKRNPDYEMAFNAKINRATCTDVRNEKSADVKKELAKMLKDEKNKDFLDQIYYALGSIALQEKDIPTAIDYFTKSSRSSSLNTGQKALSYLALGTIYYDKREYRRAKAFHDSTIAFLDKDHPEYPAVADRAYGLNKLIKYLDVIQLEDSLQRLANLSERERERAIDDIIEKRIKEYELKKKQEEELKAQNALLEQQNASVGASSTTGQQGTGLWYFYNPSTVSFGFSEFLKKWGSRQLEDNWRRVNKEQIFEEIVQATTDKKAKSDTTDPLAEIRERTQYLKNIPLTQAQMKESVTKLIDAYYYASLTYKEQFQDYQESAATGETLLRKFPESDYKLSMYYNLYIVYKAWGNIEKSDYYKNILLRRYPDSEYAQIISDPDYVANYAARKEKIQNYYAETYEMYKKGNYDEVINRCNSANQQFTANKIKSKFDYLKALAIGKRQGPDELELALKAIIKNYPRDEVKPQAEDILAYLAEFRKNKQSVDNTQLAASVSYNFNPDTAHYYIVTIPGNTDISSIRTKIQAYNTKYYSKNNPPLSITSSDLNSNTMLLVVKSLTDRDFGEDYLYGIKDDKEAVFESLKSIVVEHFIISPNNFNKLLLAHDISSYRAFFKINYPEPVRF